jgi:peroxiredoxin
LRLDDLERRLPGATAQNFPTGLSVGEIAPEFELPAVAGGTLTLFGLRQRGTAILLVFTDPHCRPCAALLPRVAEWQRTFANRLQVAVISRGALDTNAELASRHGLANVMPQRDNEVADAYRVAGTPAAVLVRADGSIGSAPALGDEAIVRLLTGFDDELATLTSAREQNDIAPTTGLTYGPALR